MESVSSGHAAQPNHFAPNDEPQPIPYAHAHVHAHGQPPRSLSHPSLAAPPLFLGRSQPYCYHPQLTSSQYHPPRSSEGQTSWNAEELVNLDDGVPLTSINEELESTDKHTVQGVGREKMLGCPSERSIGSLDRRMPHSFKESPHHFHRIATYSHHGPSFPASQYCLPPPPSYFNAHRANCTWNAHPPPAASHPNTNIPYHLPSLYHYHANICPQPAGFDPSAANCIDYAEGGGRKWIPTHVDAPPKERKRNPTLKCTKKSQSITATSKTVRRRKKMYSDFVGVTYNKTHAKYQACITHYRKQHYLGRYKLAVDAALAYDESARLLKGSSWKVNFQTRHDYEVAKFRELESFGKMGGGAVDVAGSLAAVALKVEEIASNVGLSGAVGVVLPRRDSRAGMAAKSEHGLDMGKREDQSISSLPQMNSVNTTPLMLKVTPSPTLLISTRTRQQESSPQKCADVPHTFDTPLSISPDAIRHTMGADARTPDSVIRPTLLTYKERHDSLSLDTSSSDQGLHFHAPARMSLEDQTNQAHGEETAQGGGSETEGAALSCDFQNGACPDPQKAVPPLIQNGTLAAASALMTLFGNDKNSQDDYCD